MSRFVVIGVAAIAAMSLAACTDAAVAPTEKIADLSVSLAQNASADDQVVEGEILVKFNNDVDPESKAKGRGLGLLKKGYGDAFVVLKANKGQEKQLAKLLESDADVEWAEPNYLRQPTVVGYSAGQTWAFYNAGGRNMNFFNDASGRTGPIPSSYASLSDADEDAIGGIATTGAVVTIGSIDTGADYNHPELNGLVIKGKDWIDNDNDPLDTEGHGTHTTGTMAGRNVGVAGVTGANSAGQSHVLVYVQRVCGPSGCPTSAIINAINAATAYRDGSGKPLVAVNMSLGGSFESKGEKTAIQKATAAGILVIASAGNSGTNRVACPACDANAISVAATNWRDVRASYSQYGSGLDISAPGGECYSNTTPEGCIFSSVPGGYDWYQGTSMAAPQVTGTAGVVASVTGLRGSSLRSRLLSTADDLGAVGYDTGYGAGRLNTYRAVNGSASGAAGGQ